MINGIEFFLDYGIIPIVGTVIWKDNLHEIKELANYLDKSGINYKFLLGNILNDDLLNIWNYSDVLQEFRDLTVDKIEGCSTCKLRNYCGGGCRAIAYSYTNNIKSLFPFCIQREKE